MKFIIYTYPFSLGIGGVKVLHKLCDLINKSGHEAYLYPVQFPGQTDPYFIINEDYNTPIVTQEILNNIKEYVVIYPEIIYGNPLNAPIVVRWILNSPEMYLHTYGKDDIIMYYSSLYYSEKLGNKENILTVTEYHSDIFKNYNINRPNICFAIRKCPSPIFIHPPNSIEISWSDAGNLSYISQLFNQCTYFYCYDDITFLSVQAAMCGCVPIIIPYRYTKQQWYDNIPDICKYGVAYGNSPDEIEYAISSQPLLIEKIYQSQSDTSNIIKFINICHL